MADPPKRTISAKLILKDILGGMDESEIKRKFKLSDKGYRSVLQKLSAMGLLKEPDTLSRTPTPRQEPMTTRAEASVAWRCPACGKAQPRAYEECPHCGVIAAKAATASFPGRAYPQSYRSEIPQAASNHAGRWTVVLVSIVALVVVGGALLKRSSSKASKASLSAPTPVAESVRRFTTATFDGEVKHASKSMPVLVMFYADW